MRHTEAIEQRGDRVRGEGEEYMEEKKKWGKNDGDGEDRDGRD